jgi:CheY-like chemotaxis protein
MIKPPPLPVQILLVDDDQVDVMAMKRAFRDHSLSHPITVAKDGLEALSLLRGEGRPALPSPCIIVLDLNMPRMNGLEFLAVLREDPMLRRSIVFVLTTSSSQEDRQAAYAHHIAGYVTKSRAGISLEPLIKMLQLYCDLVDLPSPGK